MMMTVQVSDSASVSELQLCEDGVSTISRHRDAVDAAARASTRRARAVCRDGVRAAGQRHHDVHFWDADDGPGPVQRA